MLIYKYNIQPIVDYRVHNDSVIQKVLVLKDAFTLEIGNLINAKTTVQHAEMDDQTTLFYLALPW